MNTKMNVFTSSLYIILIIMCSSPCLSRRGKENIIRLLNEESENSIEMPLEEGENVRICGRRPGLKRNTRIVGGQPADYPWVVYSEIRFKGDSGSVLDFSCGASIIHKQWLLTAAHCVQSSLRYGGEDFKFYKWAALFGESRLPDKLSAGHILRTGDSSTVHVHEKYRKNKLADFDAALLRLEEPIEFSDTIQPICLPLDLEDSVFDKNVILSGWGRTSKEEVSEVLLKESSIPLKSDTCQKAVGKLWTIQPEMMCCISETSNPCEGDSGGVVQYLGADERYRQLGIISMGPEDNHGNCMIAVPSIQTYVPKIMEWIRSTTGLKFDK